MLFIHSKCLSERHEFFQNLAIYESISVVTKATHVRISRSVSRQFWQKECHRPYVGHCWSEDRLCELSTMTADFDDSYPEWGNSSRAEQCETVQRHKNQNVWMLEFNLNGHATIEEKKLEHVDLYHQRVKHYLVDNIWRFALPQKICNSKLITAAKVSVLPS